MEKFERSNSEPPLAPALNYHIGFVTPATINNHLDYNRTKETIILQMETLSNTICYC